MRTKDEILKESSDREADAPNWSFATLSQERLRLEVWIDIRDTIQFQLKEIDRSIQEGLKKD